LCDVTERKENFMTRMLWTVTTWLVLITVIAGCDLSQSSHRIEPQETCLNEGVKLTASTKRLPDRIEVRWVFRNDLATPIWIPVLWKVEGTPHDMPFPFYVPPDELVLVFGEFRGRHPWSYPTLRNQPVDMEYRYQKLLPGEKFEGVTILALPYKRQEYIENPFLVMRRGVPGLFHSVPLTHWIGPAIPRKTSLLWIAVEYNLCNPDGALNEELQGAVYRLETAEFLLSTRMSVTITAPQRKGLALSNVIELEVPFKQPSKAAIAKIIENLASEDLLVRSLALRSIRDIGPVAKAAVGKLVQIVQNHDDPDSRSGAATALNAIGPCAKGAIPALTAALNDPKQEVREEAAAALGSIGIPDPAAVRALVSTLKDKEGDVRVRVCAASALGTLRVGDKAAIRGLIDMLKDNDPFVRSSAAYSLGDIGPAAREAIPALRKMLKDKDEDNQVMAAQALKRIERK